MPAPETAGADGGGGINGSGGFAAVSSLFSACKSWVKPPCAIGAGSGGRGEGVWKEKVLDCGAGAGSGRSDFSGSSAGVLSSGLGANICVKAPGPDCCGGGNPGAAGGVADSFGGVNDWNIRVKSPGLASSGLPGCGAADAGGE